MDRYLQEWGVINSDSHWIENRTVEEEIRVASLLLWLDLAWDF
jgi:hypothetical protein